MVWTGSSEAGRSSHREPSSGADPGRNAVRSGGWGSACPQEQPLPVAFPASLFGFPLIISPYYLYVCNYLFFNYMSVRVFHPRNWPAVRVFHQNHPVRSEVCFTQENSP